LPRQVGDQGHDSRRERQSSRSFVQQGWLNVATDSWVPPGVGSVPLTQRSRDEPSRAGDEAAEDEDDRAGEAQEEDPDAPGLGIVHDDEREDIPEPNEPG
jgi:hypothetical protein